MPLFSSFPDPCQDTAVRCMEGADPHAVPPWEWRRMRKRYPVDVIVLSQAVFKNTLQIRAW